MTAGEHISTAVAHLELADAMEQKMQPRRDELLKALNSARMFALRAATLAGDGGVGDSALPAPHIVQRAD